MRLNDRSIETLRGIAVVLMVAGHVVGAQPDEAMRVDEDSGWRLIFWALRDLRMPLFTVLSGFIYAFRPTCDWLQYRALIRAKVRRFLVPLISVGTLVFWAKMLNPESRAGVELADWWTPYVLGLDHLWFLHSIFVIFVVVGALGAVRLVSRPRDWLVATLLSACLYVSALVPEVAALGIGPALRLLPFFLLGYGLRLFSGGLSARWVGALAVVLAVAFSIRLLDLNDVITIEEEPVDRALGLIVGATSILILFRFRDALSSRFLAWIGGYAFGIYLFHYFALPLAWIGSRAIGLEIEVVKFLTGLILGIGLPILFELIARRSRWATLVLFGQKMRGAI